MSHVKQCSKCGVEHVRAGQRYCLACHAAYMRGWRKSHPLDAEQKIKDRARSYAGEYKRRGKIEEKPCFVCASPAQMHHPDYSRPVDVEWLCRKHHLDLHTQEMRRIFSIPTSRSEVALKS